MTEDSKAVVTRGCTAMQDESQYKCTTHTAGGQVVNFLRVCLNKKSDRIFFLIRDTLSATAMAPVVTMTGKLLDRSRRWRCFQ